MKIINLSGRIDSNNAGMIESEISSWLAENPAETPAFDADNLEYISSAGLRVLLKFRKMYGEKLYMFNVSDEVYNIFDVTGFIELFSVIKKPREISTTDLEMIGGGAFSSVFRADTDTIIKVYSKLTTTLADVERDRLASREVFIHGIPTAIPFEIVRAGQHYGLVYEMIDADTLSDVLTYYPERLEELSIKTARLLKKLHATEFEPGTFSDARDIQRERIQGAFGMGLISADDKAIAEGIIDRIPYRNTFIHSDFHTGNLMVKDDDLFLVDVGGAGLGDPINDLLVSYYCFAEMDSVIPESSRHNHERITGLERETLCEMWKIIMREYFGTSDNDTLSHYSDIISIYASLMMLEEGTIAARKGLSEASKDLAEKCMSRIREAADTLRPIEGI